MFKRSFTVARILGIPIRIHWTFFLLLAWFFFTGTSQSGSFSGGLKSLVFVLTLFACVVAHEFGHILAARSFGIKTRDVTLLPIGGVAALEKLPEKPWQELVVAIAGPLVNVVIALSLIPGLILTMSADSLTSVADPGLFGRDLVASIALVNIWLVLFNMIPAFPMDGGRVLRAFLAMLTDRVTATRAAAIFGQVVAVLMGLAGIVLGRPMLVILAMFVFMGARAEAAGTVVQAALARLRLGSIMLREFRVLAASDFLMNVEGILRSGVQPAFPVTEDGSPWGRYLGMAERTALVEAFNRVGPSGDVRSALSSGTLLPPLPPLTPTDTAMAALERLQKPGCTAVPVMDGDRLVGLVTRELIAAAIQQARRPGR